MNTKQKGELSEAKLLIAFLSCGKSVSKPFGDNQKYDLIIDDGSLKRIQVKTGKLTNGVITANTCRSVGIWKAGKERTREKYTNEQIDAFGIYCPENDKCYIVPLEAISTNEISLRIDPPKNNQLEGIRWAKDYEITA